MASHLMTGANDAILWDYFQMFWDVTENHAIALRELAIEFADGLSWAVHIDLFLHRFFLRNDGLVG